MIFQYFQKAKDQTQYKAGILNVNKDRIAKR